MVDITFNNFSLEVGSSTLLSNINLTLGGNEFVALIGPNGAGKSTLIRSALTLHHPTSGTVTINGVDASMMSPIERARAISYLPQSSPLAWPVKVADVVTLGRFAYGASLASLEGDNKCAVEKALKACGLTAFANREIETLSGGEQARVHFARALVADTPCLFADEPIAGLDPYHQFKILKLIKDYVTTGGSALVVLHDIALASRFADRIIWMKDGMVTADGSPNETVTPERLEMVYSVSALVDASGEYPKVTMQNPL